ncbi:hypothetical protein Tco_0144513 [Tanacetum coccineum]
MSVCPHCVEELCVIGTLGVGYFAGYSPAVPYLEGWWDEWCMEWFNLIKYLDVDGLAFRQGGGMNGVWNAHSKTKRRKQKVIDSTLNEDRDDTNNNKGGIASTASSTSCDSEVDLVGGGRMSMEGCSLKLVEGSSKASTMKLKYNHG